jgi:hypothetical protein
MSSGYIDPQTFPDIADIEVKLPSVRMTAGGVLYDRIQLDL